MLSWSKKLLSEMGLSCKPVVTSTGPVFAPINIALCKYWGKRDESRHLPFQDSLSLTLPCYGAWTSISLWAHDQIILDGQLVDLRSPFAEKILIFLNLIRERGQYFQIKTSLNIPHSAGLASSAAGFAALTRALDKLYGWHAPAHTLAQIARWGSGSATRSFSNGWVYWPAGTDIEGRDSYGSPLPQEEQMPGLCVALPAKRFLKAKDFSSRAMMAQVASRSLLFESWLKCSQRDIKLMREALRSREVTEVIGIAERNARAMHATLADLEGFYHYETPQSWAMKIKIDRLRKKGWPIGWTQDAGPQVKLLCHSCDSAKLSQHFPSYLFTEVVPEQVSL